VDNNFPAGLKVGQTIRILNTWMEHSQASAARLMRWLPVALGESIDRYFGAGLLTNGSSKISVLNVFYMNLAVQWV
jgi:hypothetical protein